MKKLSFSCAILASFALLAGCAKDHHAYKLNSQALQQSMAEKYPNENTRIIYVPAADGFVASRLAVCAVDKKVNTGKVAAIASALALKTGPVVVAGEDDQLIVATIHRVLKDTPKEKLDGAHLVVYNVNDEKHVISTQAAQSNIKVDYVSAAN